MNQALSGREKVSLKRIFKVKILNDQALNFEEIANQIPGKTAKTIKSFYDEVAPRLFI